jgi:hypothetical protein
VDFGEGEEDSDSDVLNLGGRGLTLLILFFYFFLSISPGFPWRGRRPSRNGCPRTNGVAFELRFGAAKKHQSGPPVNGFLLWDRSLQVGTKQGKRCASQTAFQITRHSEWSGGSLRDRNVAEELRSLRPRAE